MGSIRFLAAILLVLLSIGSPARAQEVDPARAPAIEAWRRLAETDLEAAHALIRDNHPAAVEELGDDEFRRRLESGYALARSRLDRVQGYNGYRSLLLGFANSFGDKHIWSRSLLAPQSLTFPGFVTALRGGRWLVVEEVWPTADHALAGARLLSCDGIEVDELARRRLGGFRAVWEVEAQRIAASPWLLISDNPLLERPRSCRFERDGAVEEHELRWGGMDSGPLLAKLRQAVTSGAPGHEVRRFDRGWWIGLETLSDQAQAVVDQVAAQAEAIRRGPVIVLDMRGNGGGNSTYGRSIASAIYGQAYVEAVLSSGGGTSCGAPWRASPGNLARIEAVLAERGDIPGLSLGEVRDAMKAAIERGAAFTGPVECPPAADSRRRSARRPAPATDAQVVLITDHLCFSSCLLVTDDFRRLGALHVGESTDAATRYMEVREVLLPSNVSTFSTLQKAALDAPPAIGPFEPRHRFEGDIADTEALEAWIASLVAR